MKQIMFEKLTVDEQDMVRAGEALPSPDAQGCLPYDKPTAGCAP